MTPRVVFVDVDDTLIRTVGAKRIPMPATVAAVRRWKAEGAQLFLWSTGGADYCREVAEALGIADCFDAFLPKPTVYVDDQPVGEWRLCKHLYPGQVDAD